MRSHCTHTVLIGAPEVDPEQLARDRWANSWAFKFYFFFVLTVLQCDSERAAAAKQAALTEEQKRQAAAEKQRLLLEEQKKQEEEERRQFDRDLAAMMAAPVTPNPAAVSRKGLKVGFFIFLGGRAIM